MVRSHLTTKFMVGAYSKEARAFVKRYNSENEDKFDVDFESYITIGVIERKGLPDVGDVLTLIKLGNSGIDDTQAELKLQNALESEEYKERGLVGIFCDLCKDMLCIDLVKCGELTQAAVGLEDLILDSLKDSILSRQRERQERQKRREELNSFTKQIRDTLNSITSLGQKAQAEDKEEQTEAKEEQTEVKEEQTKEKEEQTQE